MQRKLETRTHVDVITSSGRRASSVLFVAPRKGHRRESMCKDVSGLSPYPSTYKRLRERYGAKLQLHLSPRLPILHFRIVRHSFRRSFPSFLPFFLSSPLLLSSFFAAIADFSPRGPLLRDTRPLPPISRMNFHPPCVIRRIFIEVFQRCGDVVSRKRSAGKNSPRLLRFFPSSFLKKGNLTLTNIRCVWDKNNLVESKS